MDRMRIVYHPAPAPDRTGLIVPTEPIKLGEDSDFALRWIRRRLGLRPRGPFPLTTRYGTDFLPLRDPAALVVAEPGRARTVAPDQGAAVIGEGQPTRVVVVTSRTDHGIPEPVGVLGAVEVEPDVVEEPETEPAPMFNPVLDDD